jgi:hypothetical protein
MIAKNCEFMKKNILEFIFLAMERNIFIDRKSALNE